jgi:hypothetical protein
MNTANSIVMNKICKLKHKLQKFYSHPEINICNFIYSAVDIVAIMNFLKVSGFICTTSFNMLELFILPTEYFCVSYGFHNKL